MLPISARRPFLIGLGVSACLLLVGCLPYISTQQDAPKISGTLLDSGVTVAGAEVILFSGSSKKMDRVRMDASGRFTVGPLDHIEYFIPLLGGDRFQFYHLQFKTGGRLFRTGNGVGVANEHLVCDLRTTKPTEGIVFIEERLLPSSPEAGLRCWEESRDRRYPPRPRN